jgi:hypothetical protein
MRYLLVVALLLASTSARAEKSETTAKALAGTGTGVAGALVLSSFLIHPQNEDVSQPLLYSGLGLGMVAPSFGHWYAGHWLTWGMAIRTAAAAITVYGVSLKHPQACDDALPGEVKMCESVTAKGLTLISLAAIAYIGGVAYDVRNTPDAVERYNKFHASLVPTAMPHGGGVAITGQF